MSEDTLINFNIIVYHNLLILGLLLYKSLREGLKNKLQQSWRKMLHLEVREAIRKKAAFF